MPKTGSPNKKEILALYEELRGILAALESATSWFDDEGFTDHANSVISRVALLCPEIETEPYILKKDYNQHRGYLVHTTQAKSKVSSLAGRLKGSYELESVPAQNGPTFIQNQSQTQSQTLSVALEMQEKILDEILKHAEGTKERSFLEKMKAALPTIKGVTDILSSALKIGGQVGLDPTTIHKLLGL